MQEFDNLLGQIINTYRQAGLLNRTDFVITADHGNDPTFRGSDHTREYAPLLVFGKSARAGINLGTRSSLADIGQTIAEKALARITPRA